MTLWTRSAMPFKFLRHTSLALSFNRSVFSPPRSSLVSPPFILSPRSFMPYHPFQVTCGDSQSSKESFTQNFLNLLNENGANSNFLINFHLKTMTSPFRPLLFSFSHQQQRGAKNSRKLNVSRMSSTIRNPNIKFFHVKRHLKLRLVEYGRSQASKHFQALVQRGRRFRSAFETQRKHIFIVQQKLIGKYRQNIVQGSETAKHGIKQLWHKYGYLGIFTYIGVYIGSLGLLYMAISNGLFSGDDLIKFVEKYRIQDYVDTDHIQKVDSVKGRFILAWIACKIIEPLRALLTLAIVPSLYKILQKIRK